MGHAAWVFASHAAIPGLGLQQRYSTCVILLTLRGCASEYRVDTTSQKAQNEYKPE